jgi:hypothetical protein
MGRAVPQNHVLERCDLYFLTHDEQLLQLVIEVTVIGLNYFLGNVLRF